MRTEEKIRIINDYLKEHDMDKSFVIKKTPYKKWVVEEPYFEVMQQSSPTQYSLDEFLVFINNREQDRKWAEKRQKEDLWLAKHNNMRTDGIAKYIEYKEGK